MSDYRIEFSVTRRQRPEDDFSEVGFGSTGEWSTPEQAAHILQSMIEHREWETTDGMPEPEEA